MSSQMNVQRIAVELGEIIKYTRSEKEIHRLAQAILKINKEPFQNTAITAVRQQAIYDWLCSIGNTSLLPDERCIRITEFCLSLADDENRSQIIGILEVGGMPPNILFKDQLALLNGQNLHSEVFKHSKGSFQHEKYAHAVLEVCKAFDKAVQQKSELQNDGRSLMQQAWAWKGNILRATTGTSDSDESFHEGLKLLSEGVMAGVRNISTHEPILSWPLGKEDCIDMLHLLSFLFRKLDKSVNIKSMGANSPAP